MVLVAGLSMAQNLNVYAGVGTATDDSSGRQVDTFGTGQFFTTPKLTGAFPKVGASFMLTKHLGVGADLSWRGARGEYAGIKYRPMFYNFDAVWVPVSTKRFEPELRGGIGGMKIGYSYDQTQCSAFSGCQTSSQKVDSSSHFQWHAAAAARLYVTNKVFIRPGIDLHYVHNLFQFAHNSVPEYSLGVGYSFGRE